MIRRMLIDAQRPEELRIAIVKDELLENYQIEAAEASQTRGNIYRGIVAAIQPSLTAAFIDFGAEKNGFLSLDNLMPELWHHRPKEGRKPRIEEVLDRGKPIVVQAVREAEGQKGANLTTSVSLAGRYLVFTPYDETCGVSRKVEDEEERRVLRELANGLKIPGGAGVIIRTNAAGQNKTAITRDLQALLRLWKQIQTDAKKGSGPKLLQSDQDLLLRALRDYLDATIEEIVINDDDAFEKAQEYVRAFLPRSRTTLVRYADRTPLFSRYDLEPQIDRIYERSVDLRGGGSIVIDRTEALVAIDVNSGRSKSGSSHEETVLHTNLEAASEVARQLQLRDIGGLIVVDFIDMKNARNRKKVETAVRDALKNDKARTSVGRISSNGLLEINRQKIRQALHLRTHRACPTCAGTGRIASPEMVSLNLLRRVEARATTSPIRKVRISLHPELADAFQNTRRHEIAALESEFDLEVEVIAASHLHRPQQEVEWFEGDARPATASLPAPAERQSGARARTLAEAEPETGGKRKRRRRRRRGHAGSSELTPIPDPMPGVESYEAEIPAEDEVEEAAGQAAGSPAVHADETAPKKRKRRRRRGRGGAGESAGEARADASPAQETGFEDPADFFESEELTPAATATEAGMSARAASGPRRRTRRRRRPNGRGAAASASTNADEFAPSEESLAGEPADESGPVPSFWEEVEPATARPRRRRAAAEEPKG